MNVNTLHRFQNKTKPIKQKTQSPESVSLFALKMKCNYCCTKKRSKAPLGIEWELGQVKITASVLQGRRLFYHLVSYQLGMEI